MWGWAVLAIAVLVVGLVVWIVGDILNWKWPGPQ